MNGKWSSDDFKQRAFQYLLEYGAKSICPDISIDCIKEASKDHVKMLIEVEKIPSFTNSLLLQTDIEKLAKMVSGAALSIGEDGPILDTSRHSESHPGVLPSSSEVLQFRAYMKRRNGYVYVKFSVVVQREAMLVVVCKGARLAPDHRPSSEPAASSSSAPPPPPPPATTERQSSGKRSAPSIDVANKRPAPPNIATSMAATSSPTTAGLALDLAKASLAPAAVSSQAPLSTGAVVASVAPSVPPASSQAPAPIVAAPTSQALAPPTDIRQIPVLLDLTPRFGHKFALINCGSRTPAKYDQLTATLANIGVRPVRVEFRPLFLNAHPRFVFYFSVLTDDEIKKVEEHLFREDHWTNFFRISQLSKNTPFLSRSMSVGEIFQSMLVASRIHDPKKPTPNRDDLIWKVEEIRSSLEDVNVMGKVEEKLNVDGFTMLGVFKRNLPSN